MAVTDNTPDLAADDGPRLVPARSIRRRRRVEQAVYGAAALGISIAPQFDSAWPAHLGAVGLAVGTFSWLWGKYGHDQDQPRGLGFLQAAQRAFPALSGAAVYLTNLLVPGTPWWEYADSASWALLMALTTPITHSLNLHALLPTTPPIALDAAPATQPAPAPPTTYSEYRRMQWTAARATGTTHLAEVHPYQDGAPDFWGIVVAEQGEAVPDINATTLAGIFDLPVGSVALHLIEGSGPGRKMLIARPTLDHQAQAQQDPIHRIFNDKLARPGGGATGMQLLDYRQEDNRIALRITAPDDQLIQLNQKQIARALKYKDTTLIMIETDGLGDGVVSIYKHHPLLTVREATAEDLTMDAEGTIALGLRPDGRQARVPLFDPAMGAVTDLYVGAPGAGKSVTLLTVLAAERINGIVSIVADAQDGMSLPEADGRVYHFGKGVAATAATLAAANDLGKYREKISAQNGWGSFEPGQPWAIVNITLDELNRILSADAVVPRPFRKWVTGLVGDTQSTGRKLGEGVRFAAQSIHLADLGDKDRIRANAKNGTVWLGRTNSSTTQHMASDGVLPPGVFPEPIPRYFKTGNGSDIDASFHGKEAKNGPITAGMANIIQGGSVFLGRTWYARKENKTYPGLIALLESAPMPTLTPEEHRVFQDAYAKWLPLAEALLAGDDEEGDSPDYSGHEADGRDMLADDEDDQPPPATIKARILDALADGPLALKDVRKRMPDAAAGSVNNAMVELREAGHVTPAGARGTYQLANH
ncbi:hypothetical protein PV402_39375 [Streptomyces scabiei]|uniref:hypothetical protein n=1 Tax=Streptomyces scabiei TaxID=1930 RepID=UPI0029B28628|nr:hypothetical protein [Streptomyces scabiei]MDX2658249.1 hypothetical protein [Streptomyces scabiei]MDX2870534.1 hypothetical protein [Streptomyces scabiei]